MAEYALVDAPAWDTVKASQNGDGTGTFWANSFLPLWGRLSALAEYLEYDASKLGTTLTGTELVMTAPISFESGNGAGFIFSDATAANASTTLNLAVNVYVMAAITAARTYTLPNPTRSGRMVTIVKRNNSAFNAVVQRADTSVICTYDAGASLYGSATFISRETTANVFQWSLLSWSGNVVPEHDPY